MSNNIHKGAAMLGAAVLAKLGRMGNKLRDHHSRMREEGGLSQPRRPWPAPSSLARCCMHRC
jgi:hypothetical protein